MRNREPSRTNRRAAPLPVVALATGLVLLAGCDLTGQNLTGPGTTPAPGAIPDPLQTTALPGQGTSAPPKPAVAGTAQPATPPSAPLPALPAPVTATGTALLAGSATKGTTVSAGPDLRISGPSVPPGSATGPGATLGQLPGAIDTFPHTAPGATMANPGATVTAGPNGADFDKLQAELVTNRHVAWQRLEMLSGGAGWKYTCSIPTTDPTLCTMIEAKAATPTDAMRAAIDQIDHPKK